MLKPIMKKAFLLIGLLMVTLSCSEYQKVLKSRDVGLKYKTAEKLYDEAKAGEGRVRSKFRKALGLFEQIVPEYRGKPQGQRVMYLFADTYYELGDYYLSGYQFERFAETYPQSDKAEEAAFKGAKSFYFLSPPYNLDQTETRQAIAKLQGFINKYPESEKLDEASQLVQELTVKLERKAYEIAKQYHHTTDYKAAIASFDNFISEYPGSTFSEEALYYRLESAYLYAINSYAYAMPERLEAAEKYYRDYIKYFPQGEYLEKAEAAFLDIEQKQETFNTTEVQ